MTVDTKALQELLDRAVALSEAAAEVKEAGVLDAPATPSAGAVEAAAESGVSLEDLAGKIAVLEDTIYALQNSTPEPAAAVEPEPVAAPDFSDATFDDPAEAGEPEGVDFDDLEDPAEEKAAGAWGACPECGSTNRDEFADGTARCEDCGTPLAKAEGKDFVDLEVKDGFDVDAWLEEATAEVDPFVEEEKSGDELETKGGTDTLTEMELLLARRAQLDA